MDEVEEIIAFKRDLITVDQNCLMFKEAGTGLGYGVHEEMAGYYDLIFEVLPKHLPGYHVEWILDPTFPAFETKPRIVWKRSSDKVEPAVTSPAPQNS
jgi:hypothetical protein